MDIYGAGVSLNLLTNMEGGDLMLSVKAHEALGLQKNMSLLSHLSAFETLLNNVYEKSCPSSEDYANRRDLVRIYNEIAKEIYGNNGGCPVVEEFGSFVMDIFSARSDLDLSINFSDRFEVDRMTKIKTLRKFAKKFFALRRKGHVTTVELILSARVPVLKVTDKGSGIECDFSVGNRDGIAKSHIVLLISAIDERFKMLCFLIKAWAKAQDINSSKDGTLNSISLILLVAFHLQTLDIPILPRFSAIFKDGMDPMAVNLIPSFLDYGQRNKETLAELFVSLLVKLESVQNLWSKGLCASTYEGSWVHKDWKAAGCIRIEDFSDRSENTARAVKAQNLGKIYSAIRRSLEFIQAFTEGKLDAEKLKSRLFEPAPSRGKKVHNVVNNLKLSKLVSLNPARKKAKSSAQVGPEEQSPEISKPVSPNRTPKKKKFLKNKKFLAILLPGGEKPELSEVVSPNSTQNKKKRSEQIGPEEGQRPGKQVKLNPCSSKPPTPCKTDKVIKKNKDKSEIGMKTDTHTSDTLTSRQVLNTPPVTLCRNPLPLSDPPIQGSGRILNTPPETLCRNPLPLTNPPIQGSGRVAPIGPMKVAQSFNTRPAQSFGESGQYSLSRQPVEQYERYRPQISHAYTSAHSALNFPSDQLRPFPTQNFRSSGGFSLDQPFQHSNRPQTPHLQGYGQFKSQTSYVERLRDASQNFPSGPPYSLSNTSNLQMSDPFTQRSTSVMHSYQPNLHTVSHGNPAELNSPSLPISGPYTWRPTREIPPYQPNLHTVSHRNPAEFNTQSFPMSDPYNLGSRPSSVMHPYQPHSQDVYHRNPAEFSRSDYSRQSFPLVRSQFAANMHLYQS